MDFKELQERATTIRKKYNDLEIKKTGKPWGKEQLMQGFVGDIGDLVKLVMAKEGWREIENVDAKLKHELSDCLWSIFILAEKYDINLEEVFLQTMNDLEKRIAQGKG